MAWDVIYINIVNKFHLESVGEIDIEDISNYDVKPSDILRHFSVVFDASGKTFIDNRRITSRIDIMKKTTENLKSYHSRRDLSPLKKAKLIMNNE